MKGLSNYRLVAAAMRNFILTCPGGEVRKCSTNRVKRGGIPWRLLLD